MTTWQAAFVIIGSVNDIKTRNKKPKDPVLASTITQLQKALQEWDKIPDGTDGPVEELMKKTRELVRKLSKQMDDLEL